MAWDTGAPWAFIKVNYVSETFFYGFFFRHTVLQKFHFHRASFASFSLLEFSANSKSSNNCFELNLTEMNSFSYARKVKLFFFCHSQSFLCSDVKCCNRCQVEMARCRPGWTMGWKSIGSSQHFRGIYRVICWK